MVRVHGRWMWGCLALAGFVVVGCNPAPAPVTKPAEQAHNHDGHGHSHDEHGHNDHGHAHDDAALPESYAAGVKQLTELNEKIAAAFAKDDQDLADGPVHELGEVLEAIEPLAKKAGFSPADQATIKQAVEQLFDDFDKVDLKIHGGEGKDYADVQQQVGDALTTLQQFVPVE